MWYPTKKMGPIGSAVLTFIVYKQTDRQAKFIYRFMETKIIFNIYGNQDNIQ